MLDVLVPNRAVYGFFNHHGGAHAGQAERRNDRIIATSFHGLRDARTLALRRAGINTGPGAMDAKFIHKDQAPRIQATLLLLKGGTLDGGSLLRKASLFF